jgi:two-component system, NtrC family, nitrogen regulation response regulator NtrX
MPDRILVVDDEVNIVKSIAMILRGEGMAVEGAGSGEEALVRLREQSFDAVLLDINLPGIDGLETLRELRAEWPQLPVIMVSGHATIERAVEATRLGALDFMEKPFSRDRALLNVRNAMEVVHLRQENARLKGDPLARILGRSAPMEKLRQEIARVGSTDARVLIHGESGTGKELVARGLHDLGPRRDRPFVKLNCAAIPHDLIEAELFGAVKGAYTGATVAREGRFKAADGGTLFLDEIGDMSLAAQAKVLRVLQEGEFEPVGATRTERVDVRVLAATHKDLREGVAGGWFREDLYYRLEVVPLVVPPLRERPDDVDHLLQVFLQTFADQHGVTGPSIHPAAAKLLKGYAWPGNVRELMNLAERLVILRHGLEVTREDLPPEVRDAVATGGGPRPAGDGTLPYANLPLKEAKEALERDLVGAALARHRGNVTRAARDLGLERTNLHKRIRALGLRDDEEA